MSSRPPQKILLVEDDEGHTELIRRGFEGEDYDLLTAATLDSAREVLQSTDINLVLSDVVLPDGRGTELLGWPEIDHQIPVVVLTSHGDENVAVEAMKGGALDYVVKSPETFNEMAHIVERSLREWGHMEEKKRLERELRQSQKLEAVGRLSSGIAHDFNNLLMAIIGCSQLALRKLEDEHPARKFVEAVRDSANRGSALSNQLVTFSRKKDVDPEVFDVNEMLKTSRRLMQPLLGERINFKMRLEDVPLHVLCDRSQLEQVVLNLVVNARDAMPSSGAITLETGTRTVESDDGEQEWITLTVRDNGVGMTPETQARVFEPFFTTKPVGKGTGLGLSTVYGIVKQAGGEIHIDSELGKGTAFTISLPPGDPATTLHEPSELPDEPPTGDETILLIEDDRLVRLALANYLEQGGYTVVEAHDGEHALKLDADGDLQFDAVVSDVMLPGELDGPTTVKKLQKSRGSFPFVLVSGHSVEQLAGDGRVTRDQTVLRKPVSDVVLLTELRKVLDGGAQDSGDKARVLFIEDHELSRTTTSMLLADAGYIPLEADSGAAALRLGEGDSIDVVIVDLGLPDISGADLVKRIREESPEVPALFISGRDSSDPVVREALEIPRTEFLAKPFDFDDLRARIAELIGR